MEPDNLHPLKGKRLDCMIKLIATDMDGTLLDERGEVDLPRLERLLDHLDQKGIRFVIATGNEIHRMRQLLGPLVKRVTLVVANGARIFEDDQMILGKFWDRELVEAVLSFFLGGGNLNHAGL